MSVVEHKSASYSPRTWYNAGRAELTVAFAVDYNTAGEKLTKKAAGGNYVACPLTGWDWLDNARHLYRACKALDVKTLNVAGNGIYTLQAKAGMTQQEVNMYVYKVIKQVHEFWPIGMIVSGGQTGVDLAGAVAASVLGIHWEMTLPKGFKQRGEDNIDVDHTEQEIITQVAYWAGVLSREVYDDDVAQ